MLKYMIIMRTRVNLTVLLTGLSLSCANASAQTPQNTGLELGAAYSLLYAEGTLPFGFTFTWGRELTHGYFLVGEAAGNYKNTLGGGVSQTGLDVSHALAGGLRFPRRAGGISPFFQILAGAVWEGGSGPSETTVAVQPGAGVDFRFGDRHALRLQGDYRGIFASPSHAHEYRFSVGLITRYVR